MARIIFTLEDGTEIETELDADLITVGRHPESTVVLPSPSVSSHHATIKRRGDAYYVQDLGTTNGTKLNGVEVEEAKLEEGDRLSFGDIPAVLRLQESPVRKSAADVPKPDGVSRLAPKPGVRPGARPGPRRGRSAATYSQSSGCAGFIAVLVFLTFAFVAGLFIRHYVVHTGRFLLTDAVQIFRERFLGGDSEAPENEGDNGAKKESGKASKE